jgi:hypothetical protein
LSLVKANLTASYFAARLLDLANATLATLLIFGVIRLLLALQKSARLKRGGRSTTPFLFFVAGQEPLNALTNTGAQAK